MRETHKGAAWICSLCLLSGQVALAQEPPQEPPLDPDHGQAEPAMEPGLLPVAGSLVPGLLVHGVGHMIGGDVDTGLSLLGMEAAGLGFLVAGGAPLIATGASRRTVTPSISLVLTGFGLFVQSWVADVYGSATGGTGGQARLALPAWELEAGYRYIYDPQFAYRNFSALQAHLRSGDWRLTPSGWIAVDDNNQRLRLEGAWRALGPQQGRLGTNTGSFLDLIGAATWHNYGSDGFSVATVEGSALGRYDLEGWAGTLRGSFAELGLGLALETYTYDVPGLDIAQDSASLLLMRFAYGIYLGRGGELAAYYDHRHDDFAAGLGVTGLGGGAAGHMGLEGFYPVTSRWALTWDLQVGSSYIAGLGLRWMEETP